jgi:hypothetical protein
MHERKPIMSGRAGPPGLAVLAPKLCTYGNPGGPGGGASVAITSSLKAAHRSLGSRIFRRPIFLCRNPDRRPTSIVGRERNRRWE